MTRIKKNIIHLKTHNTFKQTTQQFRILFELNEH